MIGGRTLAEEMHEHERKVLANALQEMMAEHLSFMETARRLGICRKNLWSKLIKHGFKAKRVKVSK